MAEALYRKYRPQVFADMVGQEHIERTLRNAIEQDKLSHAYLFCGPRGTGKTTTARLLAKTLLCKNAPTPDPDGTCEDCLLVARGEHPDVYELDAASRTGVENVREEIIGRVQFAPTRGSRKIYIIDEVHMLSLAAFNALLKTLEEPPSHVLFILCTTDPQKVPETIHSRCQRFDFRSISSDSLVARLGAVCTAEGVPFEGQALELIAHRAEGGMRNALTALEQLITFGGGSVTLRAAEEMLGSMSTSDMAEIMGALGRRDAAACFEWTARFVETGADLSRFVRDMAEHVRNLYVLSLAGQNAPIEVSEADRSEMVGELQWFGSDRLARMLGVLGDLMVELKTSTNQRLSFEIACTRLIRPESDLTLEALAERIEALERGGFVAAASAPAAQPAAGQPAAALDQGRAEERRQVPEQVRFAPAAQPVGSAASVVQPVAQVQPQPAAAAAYEAKPQVQVQPAVQPAVESRVQVQPAAPVVQPQPATQVRTADALQQGTAVSPASAARPDAALLQRLSNPASLQRAWQAVLNVLKRNKQVYAVLFLNTRAELAPDGRLNVVFSDTSQFAFDAAQKPDVHRFLEDAIRQGIGADLPYTLVMAGSGGSLHPVGAAASGMRSSSASSAAASFGAPAQQQDFGQGAARHVQAQSQPQAQTAVQPRPQSQAAVQPQPQPQPAVAAANPQDVPPWEDVPATAQPQPATQPQPQSQPEAQPQAAAQLQPVAEVSPCSDQVPLDAYDDVVPYDSDDAPQSSWDVPPYCEFEGAAEGEPGVDREAAVVEPAAAPSVPAEDPSAWQANLLQAFGPLEFRAQ